MEPGFLDALFQPDLDQRPKNRISLARAANLLDISEFQLLEHAWKCHSGTQFSPVQEKQIFNQVLIQNIVPEWATRYAEKILDDDRLLREQRIRERVQRRTRVQGLPAWFLVSCFCMVLYAVFFVSGNSPRGLIPIFATPGNLYEEAEEKPEEPEGRGVPVLQP